MKEIVRSKVIARIKHKQITNLKGHILLFIPLNLTVEISVYPNTISKGEKDVMKCSMA
ncbi:MAG: hypothetical protein LWW95_10885 [Candidatus Desulfofervidus auxilii]|nr:hypothetical protein [Candidatus Desulfofervidus auxilii]